MALQGYKTTVKIGGSPTNLTSAAMTSYSTSPRTYQVTNSAQRIFSSTAALTFKSSSYTLVGSDIASVNYLFGAVTLTTTFTGGANYKGIPKVSGKYIPTSLVAGGHSYKLNQTATLVDVTDYSSSGWTMRQASLRDVDLTVDRFDSLELTYFNLVNSGGSCLIEIRPGGAGNVARGWFLVDHENRSGDVNQVEMSEEGFKINFTPGSQSWSWGTP